MNLSSPDKPGLIMRGLMWLMPRITPAHVWLYRRLRGRLVNRATGGAPVVLVTTTGRRSGQERTVTLGHLLDGEAVIVAGTNGGRPALPGWVLNLRAHPQARVELAGEQFTARAEFLEGQEWQHHWQLLVAAYPIYAQAQRFAGRQIPLLRLRRAPVP